LPAAITLDAVSKRFGEGKISRTRPARSFASLGTDAGGADRREHLVGPRLRPRHLAHLEDLGATVIVELDRLGHR
jgi:hypothetical protein